MSITPIVCEDVNCPDHGCMFCRIIAGTEPARIVAKTDRALAIFPHTMSSLGHTIVFPINHTCDMFTARWEDLSDAMWLAKIVALQLRDALGCDGMNVVQNTGRCADQTVDHIHFHLIPRSHGDGMRRLRPKGREYDDETLDSLLGKIHETASRPEVVT